MTDLADEKRAAEQWWQMLATTRMGVARCTNSTWMRSNARWRK